MFHDVRGQQLANSNEHLACAPETDIVVQANTVPTIRGLSNTKDESHTCEETQVIQDTASNLIRPEDCSAPVLRHSMPSLASTSKACFRWSDEDDVDSEEWKKRVSETPSTWEGAKTIGTPVPTCAPAISQVQQDEFLKGSSFSDSSSDSSNGSEDDQEPASGEHNIVLASNFQAPIECGKDQNTDTVPRISEILLERLEPKSANLRTTGQRDLFRDSIIGGRRHVDSSDVLFQSPLRTEIGADDLKVNVKGVLRSEENVDFHSERRTRTNEELKHGRDCMTPIGNLLEFKCPSLPQTATGIGGRDVVSPDFTSMIPRDEEQGKTAILPRDATEAEAMFLYPQISQKLARQDFRHSHRRNHSAPATISNSPRGGAHQMALQKVRRKIIHTKGKFGQLWTELDSNPNLISSGIETEDNWKFLFKDHEFLKPDYPMLKDSTGKEISDVRSELEHERSKVTAEQTRNIELVKEVDILKQYNQELVNEVENMTERADRLQKETNEAILAVLPFKASNCNMNANVELLTDESDSSTPKTISDGLSRPHYVCNAKIVKFQGEFGLKDNAISHLKKPVEKIKAIEVGENVEGKNTSKKLQKTIHELEKEVLHLRGQKKALNEAVHNISGEWERSKREVASLSANLAQREKQMSKDSERLKTEFEKQKEVIEEQVEFKVEEAIAKILMQHAAESDAQKMMIASLTSQYEDIVMALLKDVEAARSANEIAVQDRKDTKDEIEALKTQQASMIAEVVQERRTYIRRLRNELEESKRLHKERIPAEVITASKNRKRTQNLYATLFETKKSVQPKQMDEVELEQFKDMKNIDFEKTKAYYDKDKSERAMKFNFGKFDIVSMIGVAA